jgi:hypothetical protein
MSKIGLILVGVFVSFIATQPFQLKKPRPRNRNPVIKSFTSSLDHMVRCHIPNLPDCTASKTSLNVEARDPDGDRLIYRYEVSGGRIVGAGPSVVWNLEDLPDGEFTATVFASDKKGGETSSSILFKVATTRWTSIVIPCPVVSVECADNYSVGQRAVFTATVSGGDGYTKPTFYWTVNWGRIVTGQGTTKIEIEHKEKWGETLTATVSVGGYDPSCYSTASCSSKILE